MSPKAAGSGSTSQAPSWASTLDGLSSWTDATGPKGSGLVVRGSGGAITCEWTANNLWGWGDTDTPERKLYHGLLDDSVTDSASVTFTGLQAWLATIGRESYSVRVYRNTDTIQSFTDVDILSGGSVVDVIKFPDEIRDFPRSGMRAKNDSGGLTADRITINPYPLKWGESRATISAVRIIANPGAEADSPSVLPSPTVLNKSSASEPASPRR